MFLKLLISRIFYVAKQNVLVWFFLILYFLIKKWNYIWNTVFYKCFVSLCLMSYLKSIWLVTNGSYFLVKTQLFELRISFSKHKKAD